MAIKTQVWSWSAEGRPSRREDELAPEEPLEIRLNTRPIAVTMRTPGHDIELAAGFLVAEGVIRLPTDLAALRPYPSNPAGNVLDVFLATHVPVDLSRLTRHVFASSSCGLCGKATIASVRGQFEPLRHRPKVRAEVLQRLPDKMKARQKLFQRTGGLHAAALFSLTGRLLVLREDVGRHNAVDKLLGHALLRGRLPLARHILAVSGRASFEIVQKAVAGGIPVVVAVSAPSSLAVDFARETGQILAGFVRGSQMNLYAGRGRVIA